MPTASQPKYRGSFKNLPDLYDLHGAVVTAASPTRLKGKGFTVSKQGTGVFRITFNQKMVTVISAIGFLRKSAGEAVWLSGPQYVAGNNYVDFRVENSSATATDPNVADVIEFTITVATNKLSVT